MKTLLSCFTLALLAFVPPGAAAQSPVYAGDDVVLECESENGTEYTLNTSAPTGGGIVNEWTTSPVVELENADTLTPTGEFPPGVTTVTLTSTGAGGLSDRHSSTVTVRDTRAPVVRVQANPFYLWPPNHSMHEVEVRVRIRDRCRSRSDFDVVLVDVESNEPDNGSGDGNTVNDIQGANIGSDDRNVRLRAERSGNGNGRIYTLTYRVTDRAGNYTHAEANVYVPHDYSDLRDLIGYDGGDPGDIDAICPRPADAVEELTEAFPGLGSIKKRRVCNHICKTWAKSCDQIAVGTAKCVQGEEKALSLIALAECKNSDRNREARECRKDVKEKTAEQKVELREEAEEARETCARQGRRCANACDDMFGG